MSIGRGQVHVNNELAVRSSCCFIFYISELGFIDHYSFIAVGGFLAEGDYTNTRSVGERV